MSKRVPEISLLIPSFEDERILTLLRGINDFPRENFEVVVQDGGSQEDLLQRVKENLASTDSLFIEKDEGIFDAINRGIEKCSGKYILTIGTDDIVTKESLKKISVAIQNDHKMLFFTAVRMVSPISMELVRYWPLRRFSYLRVLCGMQYPHFGMVASKSIYKNRKFNTANKINADYEFFYELSKVIGKDDVGYVNDAEITMRLGGTSTRSIAAIIGHQMRIVSFAFRRNPILLIGLMLKPLYKAQEVLLAQVKRTAH